MLNNTFVVNIMKPKKFSLRMLCITLFCFVVWGFSFSQNYTNYTVKEGLTSNHVYTILQDAKGFVWFLTDKGMVKFNGRKMKQFTTKEGLPNNDVWDAYTTPDNKTWFLTKASKLGYILNDSVASFSSETPKEIFNPIFSSQIANKVYPTGPKKSYSLIDGQWKVVLDNSTNEKDRTQVFHSKIAYLRNNYISDSLLVYGKDHSIKAKIFVDDFNTNNRREQITDSLFFYINEKGYHVLNLNTLELKQKTFKGQLNLETVMYPRVNLVHGDLQITGKGFVGFLNEDLNIENTFFFPKELNSHFGFIDRSKTVWLATFNNGVYKIPYVKRDVVYSFLGQKVQSLNIIKDRLIASVYDVGFSSYDSSNTSFKPILQVEGYTYGAQYIDSLQTTYFLSNGNVYSEYNNKQHLIYDYSKNGLIRNDRAKKVIYHNGELYGSYAFGVNKLNSNTFDIEKTYFQKGANDMLSFGNHMYIATTNGLKVLRDGKIVPKTFEGKLLNKSILSLKKLTDTAFLVNTDGFGSYVANEGRLLQLSKTEYLSVQDAFVKTDRIWLATNKGVLQYKRNENKIVFETSFSTKNGLLIDKVNQVVFYNDQLFVATDIGLAIVPKSNIPKPLFLDVNIDEVIYDSNVLSNHGVIDYRSDNTVSVSVSSIDFSEIVGGPVFEYKLSPLQRDFISSSTQTITYSNLQPEKYLFVIRKGAIQKSFAFSIKPLWWQTFWSRVLMAIIIVAFIFMFVWWLSKRVERKRNEELIQEKQLAEIQLKALRSQMNPHFVFNSLAAIQYFINTNELKKSEQYLVKFSKLIRRFFELSKESEILLEKEIKLLNNYLEIEKLRFGEKLDYEIISDEKLKSKEIKIPSMLIQPIVENSVNHGVFNKQEKGRIIVRFKLIQRNKLSVEIIDNGVGFVNTKSKTKKKINSSNILEDRLKYLNNDERWQITYATRELHPNLEDRGSVSTFVFSYKNL